MDGDTIRRQKPPEKTIGPETFHPPEPAARQYSLRDASVAPGVPVVTQTELDELADLEGALEALEADIAARKQAIVERLRSGHVVESGKWAAAVKENMKQKRVDWKSAFVEYNGEAEAKKVESVAKSGPREVSSYSLEYKEVGGK